MVEECLVWKDKKKLKYWEEKCKVKCRKRREDENEIRIIYDE